MLNEYIKILIISSTFLIINANKNEYIFERFVKDYIDTQYADFNLTVTKIRRNENGLTGFLNIYQNVSADTYLGLQLYALFSNEYRLMPAAISKPICELLRVEWQIFADEVRKVSNLPKYCPVPAGSYYVKNFLVDSKNLPETPWDKMMIYANYTLRQNNRIKFIAGVKLFIRYDRDAVFLRRQGLN